MMSGRSTPTSSESHLPKYECMVQKTKDLFKQKLKLSHVVSPGDKLTGIHVDKIAASSLEVGEHFKSIECSQLPKYEEFVTAMCNNLGPAGSCGSLTNIIKFISKIMQKLIRTDGNIRNEQELRYVIGDPIMEMLCETFQLKVRLEETVRKIGEKSHADYTCYSLRNSGDNKTVAVIIMSARSTNVTAQTIGYYADFETDEMAPPLCFIITETDLQLLLFPFTDGQSCLINAVVLPALPLWEERDDRCFDVFDNRVFILLSLFLEIRNKFIPFKYPCGDAVRKSLIHSKVVTETKSRTLRNIKILEGKLKILAELKKIKDAELKDKDAELKDKDAELEKLRAIIG